MTYVIYGDPVALARARFGQKKVWDSQKSLKLVAGIDLRAQHGDLPLYEGPLHMDVVFIMPLPSKLNADKRRQKEGTWHLFRPDLSNLVKYIEDVGTGILYGDDCIIASIACKKVYGTQARTEFTLSKLY